MMYEKKSSRTTVAIMITSSAAASASHIIVAQRCLQASSETSSCHRFVSAALASNLPAGQEETRASHQEVV